MIYVVHVLFQLLYIRYRYTCLKMVAECFSIKSIEDDEQQQKVEQIGNLLEDFQKIISSFKQEESPCKWLSVHHQQPSELLFLLKVKHHLVVQAFVNIYLLVLKKKGNN